VIRPSRTLAGEPQRQPEEYGEWPRRQRLFNYALERLTDPGAEGRS